MNVLLELQGFLLLSQLVSLDLELKQVNVSEAFSLLLPQIALCLELLALLIDFGPLELLLSVAFFFPLFFGIDKCISLTLELKVLLLPVPFLFFLPLIPLF